MWSPIHLQTSNTLMVLSISRIGDVTESPVRVLTHGRNQMDFSTFLGGLGIGSLLATFIKADFDNKQMLGKRAFEEKRDAYISYLQIAASSQTMPSEEALWARTAAIERISLCGSSEVIRLLGIVSNSPPNSPRDAIHDLIKAMRADMSF
jgi:hypothetical protein